MLVTIPNTGIDSISNFKAFVFQCGGQNINMKYIKNEQCHERDLPLFLIAEYDFPEPGNTWQNQTMSWKVKFGSSPLVIRLGFPLEGPSAGGEHLPYLWTSKELDRCEEKKGVSWESEPSGTKTHFSFSYHLLKSLKQNQ